MPSGQLVYDTVKSSEADKTVPFDAVWVQVIGLSPWSKVPFTLMVALKVPSGLHLDRGRWFWLVRLLGSAERGSNQAARRVPTQCRRRGGREPGERHDRARIARHRARRDARCDRDQGESNSSTWIAVRKASDSAKPIPPCKPFRHAISPPWMCG